MADHTVKEWMEAQDVEQREMMARDFAGSIDLGVLAIPNILQELQPYLNGNATQIEAGDGMKFLSMVLTCLQTDLGRADLHALVEYLCVRLENKDEIPNFQAGVNWTALSLQALARMTARFPRGDASVVAKAVFSLTSFREQLPATRLTVFELLEFLHQTYSATITRDMGPHQFVQGLVSAAEFEKDPRCLKVLFLMYEEISQSWPLDAEAYKGIWDSYSRYFPITLKTTDPSVPTREELQLLLVRCFASNDNYAAYTFPYLFDGLDTSLDTLTASVKNAVLETFEACINTYSTSTASEWSFKIWDQLKFEVWDGTNDDFIGRTLAVFSAIVRKLDSVNLDWKSLDTPLAQFVITTSTECCQRLQDSKSQHVLGSGQILQALGSASHFAFDLVIRNVLPRMFLIWDDLASREKKTLFLAVFNRLLQARLDLRDTSITAALNPLQDRDYVRSLQGGELSVASSLRSFQQCLVDDVLIKAMLERDSGELAVDTPFQINTIKGLVLGTRIPGFLSDAQKGMTISEFNDLVMERSQKEAVHNEVVAALRQISVEDPERFHDITIPKIMVKLPGRISSDRNHVAEEMNEVLFILEAFMQIACTTICKVEYITPPPQGRANYKFRVFDEFQRGLMQKLFSILLARDQLEYVNAILAAMYRGLQLFDEILAEEEAAGDAVPVLLPETSPYTWIVLGLYQKFLEQKEHESGSLEKLSYMGFTIILDKEEKINDMFVSLLGRITTSALRSNQTTRLNNFLFDKDREMDREKQLSQIWCLFCGEKPKDLIDVSQQNLEEGPAEKCLTNVLSMSLVAGIRREDKDELKIHIGNTAMSMIKNAISTKNNNCSAYARISMLHFLQLLINKFGATMTKIENEDHKLVKTMTDLAVSCVSKTNELEIERIYQTLAYFTAACLAAGDRSDKELLSQMLIGVGHPLVGRKVAQSFRILLAPSQVMNEKNFCVIRKLRKQRLYQLTVDKIIGMWRGTQNKDEKENCLIALAGIFAYMEPNILEENAATIFPLVLEGTNVQNDDYTMYSYISLIQALVVVCPDVISSHVDSIINRMTDRTHNTYDSPSDASVKCRTAALDVLALLVSHMERRVLLRRKAKIMVELDVALDDCSRTVRSAAERTKMRWFNLVDADS